MLEKPVEQENPVVTQEKLALTIRPMSIHRRIKERREQLNLSMEALAALVGVKAWQTVQQWEKDGGTAPKRDRLAKVAEALQTTPEYLLFGDESENKKTVGNKTEASKHPLPLSFSVNAKNFRRVYAVGRAQGGLPERIWTDGDYPVGATDEYAEVATPDPHAFLCPVVGTSMVPKFNPGDFVLVEPSTDVEIEDDVLVRLVTGETMVKRLTSRRGGIQLSSYNEPGTLLYKPEEISWMYYIAHYVPARKIKNRM